VYRKCYILVFLVLLVAVCVEHVASRNLSGEVHELSLFVLVMFRVIAVHPNLRPYKNSMDIVIVCFSDVASNCCSSKPETVQELNGYCHCLF